MHIRTDIYRDIYIHTDMLTYADRDIHIHAYAHIHTDMLTYTPSTSCTLTTRSKIQSASGTNNRFDCLF